MVNRLKKKSIFAYLMITLIVIVGVFIIVLFVREQKNSGNIINITGKQRALIQRTALLSNNYFDNLQNKEIKKKIDLSLRELQNNHKYIKNIDSPIIDNIMYDSLYQYDNLLYQYEQNIIKFANNPTEKLLKIINFTNESLFNTADILVVLLAGENDKKVEHTINLAVFLSAVILIVLFFIYTKVTLVSVNEAEENLRLEIEQKNFIKSILENTAHAIIATDTKGKITLFNKRAEELLGYKADDLILKETPAIFHKEDEVLEKAKQLSEEFGIDLKPGFEVFVEKTNRGLPNKEEWTYIHKDGHEIIVKLSVTKLIDSNNTISGYLGMAEDITILKYDEFTIKKYIRLIDKNIITSSTNLQGKITYTSDAFCKISGYSKDELIGKNHNLVRHPDMPKEIYQDLWAHLTNDKEWQGEIKNLKKDGGYYWVRARILPNYDFYGKKIGYTAIRQDITDKKLIEKISITDGLTDIFNRRHFDDVFPRMLNMNNRDKEFICFLIMDVDHFKQYNDTYGHQMGDSVLINIADALRKSLKRKDDLCFRLGGEEFGAVYYSDSNEEAYNYANEIKENIENLKIEHSGNSASKYITASMGLICLKQTQNANEDVIYREADKLLYQAKEQGRNKIIMEELQ